MAESREKRRVVIVGAGFAGFNAARELSKLVGATTEIVVINSTDYFLYLPLMPQVSGGLIEPAHVLVSLPRRLRKTRFVLGTVNHVDSRQKVVSWEGPEGAAGQVRYDRLILTAGSVNKLLPIPGIADYAHGFRTIAEAGYLRDHIIRQLELASVAADSEERRSRCTFVVVGAGYTGTEVTAQGQLMTTRIAKQMPGLAGQQVRWMLLDTARGCWHSWIRGCRRRRPGPVLALTVGVIVISGKGSRLRGSAAWIGGLLVGGGYWYARNLVVSGNPFPWQDIGPIQHAEALQGRHPYAIVHYATDTDVWGRYFTPALHERLGDLWPAYLALAVIAVLLVLWRGGRMERMLGAVALLSAIAYLLTPLGASGAEGMPVGFRLNIRYLAPGLVLALTLLAIPPFRGERRVRRLGSLQRIWRLVTLLIFAVLVIVSAGAIGAIDTGRLPGTAVLALAVIALPLLVVFLSRGGLAPGPLAGIGVAAVVALAVVGRFAQDHYLDERYSSTAPDYPKTEQPAIELGQGLGAAYDWARGTHNLKIGLAGTMGALFQYGLWGGDSSNDVRYIGEKDPRGSFRDITQCPEWIAALNDSDYDYVITTPTYHQDDPAADTAPIQRVWISRAGNVRRVAGANLVEVWQVTGPLDPLACAAPPRGAIPSATGS